LDMYKVLRRWRKFILNLNQRINDIGFDLICPHCKSQIFTPTRRYAPIAEYAPN